MHDYDDNRFSYATSAPFDDKVVENNLSEDELKIQYAVAASFVHNRAAENWIAYKVTWGNYATKEN